MSDLKAEARTLAEAEVHDGEWTLKLVEFVSENGGLARLLERVEELEGERDEGDRIVWRDHEIKQGVVNPDDPHPWYRNHTKKCGPCSRFPIDSLRKDTP